MRCIAFAIRNKKDEYSYSFSNAIRILVVVRVTGLEPVRLMSTRPSNVPVYQFQHTRVIHILER